MLKIQNAAQKSPNLECVVVFYLNAFMHIKICCKMIRFRRAESGKVNKVNQTTSFDVRRTLIRA